MVVASALAGLPCRQCCCAPALSPNPKRLWSVPFAVTALCAVTAQCTVRRPELLTISRSAMELRCFSLSISLFLASTWGVAGHDAT